VAARRKPWTFTGFRAGAAYPVDPNDTEFTVRVWVEGLTPDPQRPVFGDITPDEAETLAAVLRARAAEARKRSVEWKEQTRGRS
jgi:hypothetical protein